MMSRSHIEQLRETYLKEQHQNLYHELQDDGVLNAHLRHVQGKALVYFKALIEAGECAGRAEEKVCQEIIFSIKRDTSRQLGVPFQSSPGGAISKSLSTVA